MSWVVLPFIAGPALADALDPHSVAFRTVASVGLWAGWAVALLATLLPRTVTLTIYRAIAPCAVVTSVWAAVAGAPLTTAVIGICFSLLAAAVALLPVTGDVFIDGSSYGPERRLALRAPGAVLIGLLPLTWVATVVGVAAGPLLLAARAWVPGAILVVVGWPVAWWSARRLHGLSRRWVVFVAAGMVLHDPMALADAALIPRRMLRAIGPAEVGTRALDLTLGALGLALEVQLREPLELAVPTGKRGETRELTADRLLFTPTRPGTFLEEAADRGFPVGVVDGV